MYLCLFGVCQRVGDNGDDNDADATTVQMLQTQHVASFHRSLFRGLHLSVCRLLTLYAYKTENIEFTFSSHSSLSLPVEIFMIDLMLSCLQRLSQHLLLM